MIDLDLSISGMRQAYGQGQTNVSEVFAEIQARIRQRGQDAVWIQVLTPGQVEKYLRELEVKRETGQPLPLYGIPFAIKDNIDLAGIPTTAGCPDFTYVPEKSATVVQRLVDAGAVPVGKTNLDQFATGLVGVRSPYGAPCSVFNADYISGGSSSGSAVAVAASLVTFALGTDTAGSGRVPAAFNHLVGLKPTKGRLSTTGVVPACRSLDCVSIFAKTIDEAVQVMGLAEGPDETDPWSRPTENRPLAASQDSQGRFRFGIPQPACLEFFGDDAAAELYQVAVQQLERIGGHRVIIDYQPFLAAARLLYQGPWVVERMAAVENIYRTHPESMDPTVRQIIAGGEKISALEVFRGIYALQQLQSQTRSLWERMDVLVLPTTGTTYTIEQVRADPFQLNANLGYYTNFVNLLDLSGVAVPAGFRLNGLPFGITFLSTAFRDREVCALANRYLSSL